MAEVKRKRRTIPDETLGVFICVSISVRLRKWVSLNMVRLVSDGPRDQWNIWRYGSILASADSDLRAVVTPSEPHLAFGHFHPRRMTFHNKTEARTQNNGLGLRCRKNKWTTGRLLLHEGLHRAVLQFHATPLFPRSIHRAGVGSEGK